MSRRDRNSRRSCVFAVAAACVMAGGPASADVDVPAIAPADTKAVPAAEALGFALTYDVYTSGLRAIRFDFALDLSDPAYETRIRLETSGIVGALFNWSLEASSRGAWRDGEIAPRRYRTATVWRSRERTVAIDYHDDGSRSVAAKPPYGADDIKKVDPALIPGSVDPTTAVTALLLTSAIDGACRETTPVYDGRRRYDAKMKALPPRTFKRSNTAQFEGRAEGCYLTFERIAGFKPDRKRLQDLEVAIWLADVGVETGRLPVRLELTTPWGDGFAHLVRVRTGDGALVFGEDDR